MRDDFTVVLQPFLQDINLPFRTVSEHQAFHDFWITLGDTKCNVQLVLFSSELLSSSSSQ